MCFSPPVLPTYALTVAVPCPAFLPTATGASESEYSSLFGGESYTIEAAEPAEDAAAAAETQELLAAAEPALDGVSIDFDAEVSTGTTCVLLEMFPLDGLTVHATQPLCNEL